ncbi:DUF11 domain-containing protein [Nocardioides sp. KIGAM211]|uniref:DUF11 domain-containing protein n=1 Tax=Nocardioides luti TaxID=2761101 RepID=A0A7X0RJ98_9ACTN|nr:DUF11 domain-containing protein [Nocardioides luti]MBB6629364.1 DUF11 domain-containing protein [Nocardioides luti]
MTHSRPDRPPRWRGPLTWLTALVVVTALTTLGAAIGGSAPSAAAADPHGNNGTVKIAELGDIDSPSNDPHVGCTFQVEWYGFDEGADIISSVSFQSWAPTSDVALDVDGPETVFVGGDPATGAGTPTGLDGLQVYTLHFTGAPHPVQGYHVKLTIHTPGSIGNDSKSKVFWVEGCAPEVPANPSLALHKTVTDASGDGRGVLDEVLTYTFAVTNTGNVPLTDVRITDATIPALAAGAPCVATLAVGATTTCPLLPSATHVVSAADVTAGAVSNTATATGTTPSSGHVSDSDMAMIPTEATVPPAPVAGLSITKTVDRAQAGPGEVVTWTLTARNAGPGPAQMVLVTDTLPTGTTYLSATGTGCTRSGADVSCAIGTLAAGASSVVTIRATVDPVPHVADPNGHQLDVTKVEAHLSVPRGATGTATASCPSGYVATDGSVRMDAVDQGTGTWIDEGVLTSRATADGTGWTGTVSNAATGQFQGKVAVVCLSNRTVSGEDHSHPVVVTGPLTTTQTWGAGAHDVDLDCGAGKVAITPGWSFTAGTGSVRVDKRIGTGWHFTVDVPTSATAVLSVRCLSTTLGAAGGHTHDLVLTQLADTVVVPAGQTVERSLTCADDGKGIVASVDLDQGEQSLGSDPRPKTRAFRFSNRTLTDRTVRIGLLCLSVRTGLGGSTGDHDVVNRARVSTTSPDATVSDDLASATFRVVDALALASVARLSSSPGQTELTVAVTSSGARAATARLFAVVRVQHTGLRAGSLLAHSRARLHAGRQGVTLAVRSVAEPALRQGDVRRARLVIVTRDGHREVQIVRIRH